MIIILLFVFSLVIIKHHHYVEMSFWGTILRSSMSITVVLVDCDAALRSLCTWKLANFSPFFSGKKNCIQILIIE